MNTENRAWKIEMDNEFLQDVVTVAEVAIALRVSEGRIEDQLDSGRFPNRCASDAGARLLMSDDIPEIWAEIEKLID